MNEPAETVADNSRPIEDRPICVSTQSLVGEQLAPLSAAITAARSGVEPGGSAPVRRGR